MNQTTSRLIILCITAFLLYLLYGFSMTIQNRIAYQAYIHIHSNVLTCRSEHTITAMTDRICSPVPTLDSFK